MTQAQSTARKKLVELLTPHPRLNIELAQSTINELKAIKRRAREEEYTVSLNEQFSIDAAYEMVTDPFWKSKMLRKAGLPR